MTEEKIKEAEKMLLSGLSSGEIRRTLDMSRSNWITFYKNYIFQTEIKPKYENEKILKEIEDDLFQSLYIYSKDTLSKNDKHFLSKRIDALNHRYSTFLLGKKIENTINETEE